MLQHKCNISVTTFKSETILTKSEYFTIIKCLVAICQIISGRRAGQGAGNNNFK